jgi:Flp pilus assembly protein TadB
MPYDMLLFLSFCLLCGLLAVSLVFITLRSKRDREAFRSRAELEAKLIGQIDTSDALAKYLSAGGLSSFDQSIGLAGEHGHGRIISLVSLGSGITFFGIVLWILFAYLGLLVHVAALLVAALMIATGLALLLMAFLVYRLSVAWGLVKRIKTNGE